MDEENGQMIPLYEPPQDLHELYMRTRAEISTVQSFSAYYMKLILLIDVGKEMLLDSDSRLRDEASNMLGDSLYYPEPRQMERDGNGYRMGPGSSSTGLIHIRNEDLAFAIEEVKNQQATSLIPKLKDIDNRIFRALVESGLIDVKRPTAESLMLQDVIMSIQKKAKEEADVRINNG